MPILPNNSIPIKLIFEDEDIIVIDKQAGIPCLPLKDGEKDTIANGIMARRPTDLPEAGIVHRLDNDTSGCLVAAKNSAAYEKLRKEFDKRGVLKEYTALVLGETPPEGTIDSPIIHDPKDKKRMKISPSGQMAHTSFELVKKLLGGRFSLLKVRITTGIRHQIRVHLASIGHPLAGDGLYRNARQRARDNSGCKRQALHASKIGFHHPRTNEWLEFASDFAGHFDLSRCNFKI